MILDSNGNPIPSKPEPSWDDLPQDIQNYIDNRLNTAVDQLRENNRSDLSLLNIQQTRPWVKSTIVITFLSLALASFTYFIAPDEIKKWINTTINNKLTEPEIKKSAEKSADTIVKEKMTAYIGDKIKPLEENADKLSNKFETITNEVIINQVQLQKDQKAVRDTLYSQEKTFNKISDEIITSQKQLQKDQEYLKVFSKIQQLSISSKAGDRSAYEELLKINRESKADSNLIEYAKIAIRDVQYFYTMYKLEIMVTQSLTDSVSREQVYAPIDELIATLESEEAEIREAAVNALYQYDKKSIVEELCKLIKDEKNLRVIARATRVLEKLTGDKFEPINIEAINLWWSHNSDKNDYKSTYTEYLKAQKLYQNIQSIKNNKLNIVQSEFEKPLPFFIIKLALRF